ncbi:MAG: glycosyltransferase, partial [Rhodospirillaceae bacterium]
CEASWMGCPVVTLSGGTFAGRQAASFLHAAGLEFLIAKNHKEYEDIAVDLANDRERLLSLRRELREKIAASPACDGALLARDFTNALRNVWSAWCSNANT